MEKALTCKQVRENLNRLISSEMIPEIKGRILGHLALCQDCLNLWGEFMDSSVNSEAEEVLMPKISITEILALKSIEGQQSNLKERYRNIIEKLGQIPDMIYDKLADIVRIDLELLDNVQGYLRPDKLLKYMINTDPLFGFTTLGESKSYPETIPFYYTGLRRDPKRIAWQRMEEAEYYIVDIYDLSDTNNNILNWHLEQLEEEWIILDYISEFSLMPEKEYIWEIKPITITGVDEEKTIAGKMWLVSDDELEKMSKIEAELSKLDDNILKTSAMAILRQGMRLYDEAIHNLLNKISNNPGDMLNIPLRRTLGDVYMEVLNELIAEDQAMFNNIINWVTERGSEQLKMIYCILLGNYKRYKQDQCDNCNECGLIK